MNTVVLDCERMKYEDTGLYHYCLNLGKTLKIHMNKAGGNLNFYCPKNAIGVFGQEDKYLDQHSLHKFLMPPLNQYSVWHATYQNTDYLPRRNKRIKVVLPFMT